MSFSRWATFIECRLGDKGVKSVLKISINSPYLKKNLCHRNNSKLPKSISINRHMSKNQKFVNLSKIDVFICVSMATLCTLCPAQFHYLILYIRLVGTSMVSVTEKSFSEGQFSANVQFVDWCEWKHCMFFYSTWERRSIFRKHVSGITHVKTPKKKKQ